MNVSARPPARRHTARAASDPVELLINHVGAGGDGAGTLADGTALHVPRTLPGERVLAQATGGGHALCLDVLAPSQDRVAPPCPHFSVCGGCALQHWADAPYAAWKHDVLARALQRAGFNEPVLAPLVRTAPATRRRMDFAARRTPAGLVLGLHAPASSEIADLTSCLVLHPSLAALLAPLRALLNGLDGLRREASVLVNLLPSGLDLLIRGDGEPSARDRTKLAAFGGAQGIGRVAWAVGAGVPEIAALLRPPAIQLAGVSVCPPPGAFLQATAESETAIVDAVVAGLPKLPGRARIIELFAGIGTLSFPLAAHATVHAYEGDVLAAAALRKAAGGTRVQATQRDLTRQPLQPKELAGAAAIVLDPPFAGAALQIPLIAASGVSTVIYVSCNPAALARDAALLSQAGYKLLLATPIDQFLWSAQVEAVCVFRK